MRSATETNEVVTIVKAVMSALVGYASDPNSEAAADLRTAAGELHSNAAIAFEAGTVGTQSAAVFEAAIRASVEALSFDRLRLMTLDLPATTDVGGFAKALYVQLCLSGIVWATSQEDFKSRQETDERSSSLAKPFRDAIDFAADVGDSGVYRALVELHSTFVRDMSDRSRRLPSLYRYRFETRLPSRVIAYRLYGDASRGEELARQNRAIHPGFMPESGDAYSL